jgi:two-component system sensor histidine kinase PilS (NtrC family)
VIGTTLRTLIPDRRRLNGYLLGRIVVLLGLMPLAVAFMLRLGDTANVSFRGFFFLTGISFAVTLGTALATRRAPAADFVAKAQPAWDVFYTTGLLYLSGGWVSPFVFLYLLVIVGAAILLYRKGALITATVSSLAYGGLTAFQATKFIVPINPFPLELQEGLSLPVRLGLHMLAFYAVAFLSGHLAEELRETGERLEKAKDEILDLEHLQAAILQSMGAGLIALDSSLRPMFHNPSAEEMLRRIGLNLSEPVTVQSSLEKVFDLASHGRQEVLHDPTGTVFGYSVIPLTTRRGQRAGSILSFQDLTEVRKLEEGFKQADRLAAVGRLAAGLAHEVRNPLASLSGSVQMIEGSLDSSDEEQRKLLSIVLRETDRLNRLVSDFLQYARPGALRRTLFDFHVFIEEMGLFFRQGEGRTGFLLVNEVPPGQTVNADHEQMEQLMLNLFRNSIEAAPDGVTVTVRSQLQGRWFICDVLDDGPGLDPAVIAQAFEPFVSTKEGGTGLGLASVHRIAQNHGGTVTVESSPNGGAHFRLRIAMDTDG